MTPCELRLRRRSALRSNQLGSRAAGAGATFAPNPPIPTAFAPRAAHWRASCGSTFWAGSESFSRRISWLRATIASKLSSIVARSTGSTISCARSLNLSRNALELRIREIQLSVYPNIAASSHPAIAGFAIIASIIASWLYATFCNVPTSGLRGFLKHLRGNRRPIPVPPPNPNRLIPLEPAPVGGILPRRRHRPFLPLRAPHLLIRQQHHEPLPFEDPLNPPKVCRQGRC